MNSREDEPRRVKGSIGFCGDRSRTRDEEEEQLYCMKNEVLNSDDVIDVYDDEGCDDEEREAEHSIKTQLRILTGCRSS